MTTTSPGSREAAQALDEIEKNAKLAKEYGQKGKASDASFYATHVLYALGRLRAALAPPADGAGEVEEIKRRHEEAENAPGGGDWAEDYGYEAHDDRATLLRLLDEERARRVEVEKAARQLLNGASGHYMNAEDRWCLESLLGFYDEDMPATHKDTQDE